MVGCVSQEYANFLKNAIENAKTLEEIEEIEAKYSKEHRSGRQALAANYELIDKRKKELGFKRYGIIWRELKEPKTVKRAEAAAKRKREEAKKRKEIDESLGKALRERRKQKEKAKAQALANEAAKIAAFEAEQQARAEQAKVKRQWPRQHAQATSPLQRLQQPPPVPAGHRAKSREHRPPRRARRLKRAPGRPART